MMIQQHQIKSSPFSCERLNAHDTFGKSSPCIGERCSKTLTLEAESRLEYARERKERSDEFEGERPGSGPGDLDLVLDPLDLLLPLRPRVPVRALEALPSLRPLVAAAAEGRERGGNCRSLRPLHHSPRQTAAPLHHRHPPILVNPNRTIAFGSFLNSCFIGVQ